MFITGGNDGKISFMFYQNNDYYKFLNKFTVAKEHYVCGMLVVDRREANEKTENSVLIAMFEINYH